MGRGLTTRRRGLAIGAVLALAFGAAGAPGGTTSTGPSGGDVAGTIPLGHPPPQQPTEPRVAAETDPAR